jgi:uncharacterized protein YeaO (DUF488 family)
VHFVAVTRAPPCGSEPSARQTGTGAAVESSSGPPIAAKRLLGFRGSARRVGERGKRSTREDAKTHMDVRLKRAYDAVAPTDGYRVLVDRLWPRGVSREQVKLDAWEKDLAPSSELREWFGHDPGRFEEFRRRYIEELRSQRPRLTALRRRARDGRLTLVYSAHDAEHNDAVVLANVVRRGLPRRPR